MTIRLAKAADVAAVGTLYEKFYAYNAGQQPAYCRAAKESGAYPQSVVAGTAGDIFVAETQGELVGFIHVEELETPPFPSVAHHRFGCVVDFYVEPGYRGEGVGKALIQRAKQWGKERRLEYFELMVLEENKIGQSFYAREGFLPACRLLRCTL